MNSRVIQAKSSTQPGVDPTLKIYGSKVLSTIRVRFKNSDDDRVLIINEKDFDDEKHLRVN